MIRSLDLRGVFGAVIWMGRLRSWQIWLKLGQSSSIGTCSPMRFRCCLNCASWIKLTSGLTILIQRWHGRESRTPEEDVPSLNSALNNSLDIVHVITRLFRLVSIIGDSRYLIKTF